MKGKFLTEEQTRAIEENPNVSRVDKERFRIYYTKDFKRRFAEEYAEGKPPTQIFKDAGFDTKALGKKRIERAAAKWRKCSPADKKKGGR